MKLLRYGFPGQEKFGVLDANGDIRDLSTELENVRGEVLTTAGLRRLREINIDFLTIVDNHSRIGTCVGKFMQGLRYVWTDRPIVGHR